MKSPAFQWYPGDYLASQRVQLMTLEEEGAYMRLLCYCWIHGSVPSDPHKAARLIGKGASTTLATTVLTMFQPSGDAEVLVHDRLDREREKQSVWREKSSQGGKKSAEIRAQKSQNQRVVQPPHEGCLENGTNQKPTLLSPSPFTSPSSNILNTPTPQKRQKGGSTTVPEPSGSAGQQELLPSAAEGTDKRHCEISSRWGELFQSAFGAKYSFTGRDAAALKRFLQVVKDDSEAILTVAVQAWERTKQDRYAKRCKEAATIHGLCTFFNEIRVELKAPGGESAGAVGGAGSGPGRAVPWQRDSHNSDHNKPF